MLESGKLNYVEKTDSTMDILSNHPEPLGDYTGVYTLNQTKGRGRRGRKWEQKKGEGLAFSMLMKLPIENMPPIPLVVGLAVAEVLETHCNRDIRLKWSNDVLIDKKKVAGILCESRSGQDCAKMVAGIGVNLLQNAEFFRENNLPYGVSLAQLGVVPEPDKLAEQLAENLKKYLGIYIKDGFDGSLLKEYTKKCATLGSGIRVEQNGNWRVGTAVGIEKSGGLICNIEGELRTIYGGEVSVRGLYGYTD